MHCFMTEFCLLYEKLKITELCSIIRNLLKKKHTLLIFKRFFEKHNI